MSTNAFFEKLKSEGILLAIVPFLGSLTAFAFEIGYLTYYDVPYDVISLGIYRIMVSALWLSLALAIIWVCAARVIAIAASQNNVIKNFMLFIVLAVFITLIIWNAEFKKEMLWALAGVLIIPTLGFVTWIVSEDGPLGKKLPSPIAEAVKDGQAIASNAGRISDIYIGPFALAAIVLALVSVVGYWTAKINKTAWVLDDQPTFFLVRKYDEAYVFKEYNPKTMKMADRVQIINLSEEKEMTLKRVVLRGLTTRFGEHRLDDMTENIVTDDEAPSKSQATVTDNSPVRLLRLEKDMPERSKEP